MDALLDIGLGILALAALALLWITAWREGDRDHQDNDYWGRSTFKRE